MVQTHLRTGMGDWGWHAGNQGKCEVNEILLSVSDIHCCSWVWSICCSKRKCLLLCV